MEIDCPIDDNFLKEHHSKLLEASLPVRKFKPGIQTLPDGKFFFVQLHQLFS